MSRLDDLIAELCPDGVLKKALKDLAVKISDGMHNLPQTVSYDTGFPVISAQNIHDGEVDFQTNKYVEEDVFIIENRRTNAEENDVLLTIVGAIGRTALLPKCSGVLFQRSVCVIKPDNKQILSPYMKYALDSSSIQSEITIQAHGAAQKGIYIKQVEQLQIPVPPLEVQREIVRVLDNFTFLTAELTARKKQYEYYRDQLLSFDSLGGRGIESTGKSFQRLQISAREVVILTKALMMDCIPSLFVHKSL